ncbi:hypothetical protein [Anaerosacchariphilus polymeriproducens]|uniref:hypothetical protein n=1 Tax=Anaerosacchariphilus polymeriproducens TaxID=1812858 RepID=UPI0012D81390|nr:hypothetical protein [Anaerosacchariphilus polymeriproducens]
MTTLEGLTLCMVLFAFGSFIVGLIALFLEIIKLYTKKISILYLESSEYLFLKT